MVSVTLRQELSKNKEKIYLYLDYYPPVYNPITRKTSRREYLHMFLYSHPVNDVQKMYNRKTLEQADAIRCSKSISIINRSYGFPDGASRSASFLKYFEGFLMKHDMSWTYAYRRFAAFMHGKCTFGNLSVKLLNDYREYLLHEATYCNTNRKAANGVVHLNQNSAAKFFIILRRILKEAYQDRLLSEDLNSRLENIPYVQSNREFLLMDEVVRLYRTPCEFDVLKRASMFSIFTGLRISDIMDLQWDHICLAPDGRPCIRKTIQKTGRDETIFISEEALKFCGERGTGRVFADLRKSMTVYPLRRWIAASGIKKHITFHCFRHTYATLLITKGVDMLTVSGQLTHANIKTTQIYTHYVDKNKRLASELITLEGADDVEG